MDEQLKQRMRRAYQEGRLRVRAVDGAEVKSAGVSRVLRHKTPGKPIFAISVASGTARVTGDHSLFTLVDGGPSPIRGDALKVGMPLAIVRAGRISSEPVLSVLMLPPEEFTYDLSVPGPENFVLANGILAHNSYSIGGVSLDLEKSSKYEGAYSSLSEQFDKQLEQTKATVNVIKGLQQPRFGMGLRSAFGPYVGRGVLSPAKFIGF